MNSLCSHCKLFPRCDGVTRKTFVKGVSVLECERFIDGDPYVPERLSLIAEAFRPWVDNEYCGEDTDCRYCVASDFCSELENAGRKLIGALYRREMMRANIAQGETC